jgi:pyruvate/2-oxoglutarate dehydrogenase complex dihydrolipoamide dehydrogenase (E3) component
MNEKRYDFVVIGGGSAGYNAAATAVRLGLRTAVIEGGEEVGGLCILRGCMPSKTFLESAHRAEDVRRAPEFGVHADYHGASGPEILARKRRLIADFAGFRRQQLESGKFAFIRGRASFLDAKTIEVRRLDGSVDRIEGGAFLIATGSQTNWVNIPGLRETGVLTSDDVLESEKTPKSVIILGGGPTALEFACYYAGIGAEVTVIQRSPQLLKESDPDIAHALSAALGKRGIRILVDTRLIGLEKSGDLKRVRFEQLGQPRSVEAEEIVYSLGRRPNTEGLELARAGVATGEGGVIKTNLRQQTTGEHIFAAGDVSGPYEVVHIAIQQADLAARNAARLLRGSPEPLEEIDYSLKLFAVFTHPQLAAVGLTLKEAMDEGIEIIEACSSFDDHGKAMIRGETDGFVKLIVNRDTKKIIGAAAVGPDVSELIHEIVVAMAFGATAEQLARVPHYHPTLSEIWTYPAEALAEACSS